MNIAFLQMHIPSNKQFSIVFVYYINQKFAWLTDTELERNADEICFQ